MLRKKNWNSPKNDYDMDLWKYGSFYAIQKSITFFWLNSFLAFFLDICSFCFKISYIESVWYIPNKIHTQKCMYIKTQIPN
jgi:uncharacterized protein YcsI (UPF0317 family)